MKTPDNKLRDKIEAIIEKWGEHTSEDSIYWNSYETPHPLYALIDELVALIHKEKEKDFRGTAHIKKGKKIVERIVKASQKQESGGWEKRFDKKYPALFTRLVLRPWEMPSMLEQKQVTQEVKSFIVSELQEAEKRAYEKAYQDVAKRFRIREQEAEKRGFDKGYRACQMEEI